MGGYSDQEFRQVSATSQPAARTPTCDCGVKLNVKPTGRGGYSLHCPACKSQTFKKTPAAVDAFERKYNLKQLEPA